MSRGPLDGWDECPVDDCEPDDDGWAHGVEHVMVVDHYLVRTGWSGDPEPGDEVTHVRDRVGKVWRREAGVWWADLGAGYETHRTWWELLVRNPLTDATGDAR